MHCSGCRRCPTQPEQVKRGTPHPTPAQLLPGTLRWAAFRPGHECRERWASPNPDRSRLPQEGLGDKGRTRCWGVPQDPSTPTKAPGYVPDGSGRALSVAGPRFLGEATDFICSRLSAEEKSPHASTARAELKPCVAFCMAEHRPRDSHPRPHRMRDSHPSWHSKGGTTQPSEVGGKPILRPLSTTPGHPAPSPLPGEGE